MSIGVKVEVSSRREPGEKRSSPVYLMVCVLGVEGS